MRPLRALLLGVGLLPAIALVGAAAYGFIAPNTWEVRATMETDLSPADLIAEADDAHRWDDWMFVGDAGASDFVFIEHEGPRSGIGASAGWARDFEMGRATVQDVFEDGDGYLLSWLLEEAGRPPEREVDPMHPEEANEPTAWTRSYGEVVIAPQGGGARVSVAASGSGGPRPLGPFLLGVVASSRAKTVQGQLDALVETAEARAGRGIP